MSLLRLLPWPNVKSINTVTASLLDSGPGSARVRAQPVAERGLCFIKTTEVQQLDVK